MAGCNSQGSAKLARCKGRSTALLFDRRQARHGLCAGFSKTKHDRYLQGKPRKSAKASANAPRDPHHQGGTRGVLWFPLYGNASEADPGWNTAHSSRFVPLGAIDTVAAPLNPTGEHTAFPEISVD